MIDAHREVLVVGAGAAGLAAALAAAESGAAVTVIEREPKPGGTTVLSQGFLTFADTDEQRAADIPDDLALLRRDLMTVSGGLAQEELVDSYCAHQSDTYRWLKAHGVPFGAPRAAAGQSLPRAHVSDPFELISLLAAGARSAGANILFGTRALRLIQGPLGVVGVVAEVDGVEREISVDAVILASGGFTRNLELLEEHLPGARHSRLSGGAGNYGDGLLMARAAGAFARDLAHVKATYGVCCAVEENLVLLPIYKGGIIVDWNGRRFVDESLDYKTIAQACQSESTRTSFQIFDARVMAQADGGAGIYDFERGRAVGAVVESESIQALATEIGLDPTALRATVETYNADIVEGRRDAVGRQHLSADYGQLVPIDRGPFFAIESGTIITATYCGVAIDAAARVVDAFDRPIRGLYAAGEVTGGFHGSGYMTGTSIGKATLFGRLAGITAAADPESPHG